MVDWQDYWDRHAASASKDPFEQVLRVQQRRPMGVSAFSLAAAHVVDRLELSPVHEVLDLCCGNGLLAESIEPCCARVLAVDFCARLLAEVPARTTAKTTTLLADARRLELPPASFDRALVAAALQHFEPGEVVGLLRRLAGWLLPGGILLVTDIPDRDRMWRFFDDPEREAAHFESVEAGEPILGDWYSRDWLERAGRHAGFGAAEAEDQPAEVPYAHYRFDLRCRR